METQKKYDQLVYNLCQLLLKKKYKRVVNNHSRRSISRNISNRKDSARMNLPPSKRMRSAKHKGQSKHLNSCSIKKDHSLLWLKLSTNRKLKIGQKHNLTIKL